MMDTVEVRLFAGVRDAFSEPSISVPAEQALTLSDLLAAICTTGRREHAIFGAEGVPRPDLIIMVNGRNMTFLDGPETVVLPGDEVAIFPPIAGG
jgi:sulfur-carrier protein